jgi:hypothetical protein
MNEGYVTYADPDGRRPILGPCRCAGCGASVWWAKRMSRRFGLNAYRFAWREADGTMHRCRRAA